MIDVDRARALILDIWNKKDKDAVDELFAENFVSHDPQNPIQGRAGMHAWLDEVAAWAPDFRIDLHETVADGDLAVTRWTASGTDTGGFRGIPATGQHFVIAGMTMSKFSGDKVVESWVAADNLGLLQQVGLVPQFTAS